MIEAESESDISAVSEGGAFKMCLAINREEKQEIILFVSLQTQTVQ